MYDLYLRARYHASRWNEKDIDRAIELLEQATTLDATFGAAQGLLGYAYGVKSANFQPTDTALMEKGFAAVARALEQNEAGADAHMARGLLLWQPSQGFAQREALGEFQRALSERPSFDEAWNQRGIVLFHIGHLDEALKSIERAIALNPGTSMPGSGSHRSGCTSSSTRRLSPSYGAFRATPTRRSGRTSWPGR